MSEQNIYLSPVIAGMAPDLRPEPLPACASCPVSVWMQMKSNQLSCFCSALHAATWRDHPKDYVVRCDAREQALAELQLKRA